MAAPIASIGPAAGGTAAAAQDRVSCLMQSRSAEAVLAGAAVGACAVMLVAAIATGPVAMWALIAVGLFHAIMFPTILTLGIRGLGPLTEKGAGLLITVIAGGSLVVQGWAADRFGLQHSFLITAVCELYVMFSAVWGCRAPRAA